MIGAGGGLAGVALTIALHHALPSLLPGDFPRVDAVAVDWRVLLFAVGIPAARPVPPESRPGGRVAISDRARTREGCSLAQPRADSSC
jgi:hypothetical protein